MNNNTSNCLVRDVTSNSALSVGAKAVFVYLYFNNKENNKDIDEILSEINIGINGFYKNIRDLERFGYIKFKYLYSLIKKPMFAFKDDEFRFKETYETNDEGVYFHKGHNVYEVYIKINGELKYVGCRKTHQEAKKLKRAKLAEIA